MQHNRKRSRPRGILKPSSHSSRRYVPCSLVVWGVPVTVKTFFLGLIQLMLPVSMCRMGYALELTFGDWILRVLMIFTLTLVLLLLMVDTTLSSSSPNNETSNCRLQITPAERKRGVRYVSTSRATISNNISSSRQTSPSHKIVSFAKGTKFFRLPRPKSKRQLLREQLELQEKQQRDPAQTTSTSCTLTKNRYPTLAGMAPPPPPPSNCTTTISEEMEASPDWKRAHRLLQRAASFRNDPPAPKHGSSSTNSHHDEREDAVSMVEKREVREDPTSSSSSLLSKNLFHDHEEQNNNDEYHSYDGFDADSERDDDDTADDSLSTSVLERSLVEDDDDTHTINHEEHATTDGLDADSERDNDDNTEDDNLSASVLERSMVEDDDGDDTPIMNPEEHAGIDEYACKDGLDADSERGDGDDDTGDDSFLSDSVLERSIVEDDDNITFNHEDSLLLGSSPCSKQHRGSGGGMILGHIGEDEDSMILFEDTDDDTYDERILLGTHSSQCYSPIRAPSESSEDDALLEEELEEALVETIEQLSPTSSRLCI